MEEKTLAKEKEQTVVGKKVYTPPTLTVYGKLTELTAGANGTMIETGPQLKQPTPHP